MRSMPFGMDFIDFEYISVDFVHIQTEMIPIKYVYTNYSKSGDFYDDINGCPYQNV